MFLCGEPRLADYDLVNAIAGSPTPRSRCRGCSSPAPAQIPGHEVRALARGAALPYALGRLARNHAISQGRYADPRKGFEAMYFDSCVFDADSLAYLLKKAGPKRVMLGSDQPFPIGDPEPKKVVEAPLSTSHRRRAYSAKQPRAYSACARTAGVRAESF